MKTFNFPAKRAKRQENALNRLNQAFPSENARFLKNTDPETKADLMAKRLESRKIELESLKNSLERSGYVRNTRTKKDRTSRAKISHS